MISHQANFRLRSSDCGLQRSFERHYSFSLAESAKGRDEEDTSMATVVELCTKTLTDVAGLIEKKEVSPVELTQAMLDRISALDGKLYSYITVTSGLALQQARAAEQEIIKGNYRGPLHGMPVAVKDLCYTKGIRTTCASKILTDWKPDYNATVVDRLNAAGAVLLG